MALAGKKAPRHGWRHQAERLAQNHTGVATAAALSDLGPGSNADSVTAPRPVAQATGRAGKEFPEEFKPGLDAYFNLLEGQSTGK